MNVPNLSWQQVLFYLATVGAFVALIVFNKIDVTTALTAIGILVGHGAGAMNGGSKNGGNNPTASQTTSTP